MANIKITKSKWAWVATEVKGGFKLKLYIGENKKNDIPLTGLILASEEEVKRVVKGNIVFIHKKTVITKHSVVNK
jgi:hypothetical protein